ncbi:fungal-specific transcription factor domain-containing protein [Limtongia smithiae]|uniref:fungal-specific transcription factor domain-containing protein n=1 Tax=Limtongia smithiae TaxID=1125753 RepID=UPI0034CDA54D
MSSIPHDHLDPAGDTEPPTKRLRSIAACNRCKVRKQRCDNAFPRCTNCSKAGAECVSKEQAYPANYVHSLEHHVRRLEMALRLANPSCFDAKTGELLPTSAASAPPPPQVPVENKNYISALLQQPPADPQLSSRKLPPPVMNFAKTSSSSADLPASRDLIALTTSTNTPPSYYLGSTSGFPLQKLVQAAIYGRSLPQSFPVKTDMPLLPPLQQSAAASNSDISSQAPLASASPTNAPTASSTSSAAASTPLPLEPPVFLPDLSRPSTHPPTEEHLVRAFLATIPEPALAQQFVDAYLNGVHQRYPFIYKGDILSWNSRREEIAQELARITVRAAVAAADGTGFPQMAAAVPTTPSGSDDRIKSEPGTPSSTTPTAQDAAKNTIEYEREIKSIWFKLHMIYAIGARYLQLTGTYAYSSDKHYEVAIQYLDILCYSPLIEIVEKLLLIIVFQLRSPSGPGIWHLTGFTIRLCVEAGFHRKLPVRSVMEDQRRKRLFWSLYLLERSVSVVLGRPFCIADRDIDVELPANVDENIRDEAELEKAIAASSMTHITSMTSSIFVLQIKRIASRIQQIIYRVDKSELPSEKKFLKLRNELDEWGETILNCKMIKPLSFIPTPKLSMSEEYYMLNYHQNMRLLLVPKLPVLSSDAEEFKLCLRSSGQLCQIYKHFHQYLKVSYSFIAVQACYMAGITMIYCYTRDQSILDTQFLSDIRACTTVLYIIAERWPASNHFRDSFEAYLNAAIESGSGGLESKVADDTPGSNAPAGTSSEQQDFGNFSTSQAAPPASTASTPMSFGMTISSSASASVALESTQFLLEQQRRMQLQQQQVQQARVQAQVEAAAAQQPKLRRGMLEDLGPVQDELWDILQQGNSQQQQQSDMGDGMGSGNYGYTQYDTMAQGSMALGMGLSVGGITGGPVGGPGLGTGMGMGMSALGMGTLGMGVGMMAIAASVVAATDSAIALQQQQLPHRALSETAGSTSPAAPGGVSATVPAPSSSTGDGTVAAAPTTGAVTSCSGAPARQQDQLQQLNDMNAEFGVGIGNAALFRWPDAEFGELYY